MTLSKRKSQPTVDKPKGLQAFDHPEFIKKFTAYMNIDDPIYSLSSVEFFQTLDPKKLPGYKFDTLQDILFFEKNVLSEIGDAFARGSKDIPLRYRGELVAPETVAEFQRYFDILKRMKQQ